MERERRRPATEKRMRYFAAHVGHLAFGQLISSWAVEGEAKSLAYG